MARLTALLAGRKPLDSGEGTELPHCESLEEQVGASPLKVLDALRADGYEPLLRIEDLEFSNAGPVPAPTPPADGEPPSGESPGGTAGRPV